MLTKRFGRLTVLRREPNDRRGNVQWACLCDCGNLIIALGYRLRNGHTKSCGCLRIKHGGSYSAEYQTLRLMIQRCYLPSTPSFPNYGGRNIQVCERWRGENGYKNFIADVGHRPSPKHSIDRYPDPNGNYEPSNVRWATTKEQGRNRRNAQRLTFQDKTLALPDWCDRTGFKASTLRERLRRGWSVERTLTEAVRGQVSRIFAEAG